MKLGRVSARATVALAMFVSVAVAVPAVSATASPWTPGTTVTYNANGGTGGPTDTATYATGDTVTVQFTPAPTNGGRVFLGWGLRPTGVPIFWINTGVKTFRFAGYAVTLYAIYTARNAATLSFTDGAGTTLTAPATDTTTGDTYQVHVVTNSDGVVDYHSAPAKVCTVSSTGLVTINGAGQCNVLATVPGTAAYLPTAGVLKLNVTLNAQSPLVVTSTGGTVGLPLPVSVSGGSGAGAMRVFVVVKGNARCVMVDATTVVARHAGVCAVVAVKAKSGAYDYAHSAPAVLTFS